MQKNPNNISFNDCVIVIGGIKGGTNRRILLA